VNRADLIRDTEALRGFGGDALVLWSPENKVIPPGHGPRLAGLFSRGRYAEIPGAYVLHLHPTVVGGLVCGRDGYAAFSRLFAEEAIWLPPTMPGYYLATVVRQAMADFEEYDGRTGGAVGKGVQAVWHAGRASIPRTVLAVFVTIIIIIVFFAVMIALFVSSVALIVGGALGIAGGVWLLHLDWTAALFYFGIGLAIIALGSLLFRFSTWASKHLLRAIAKTFNGIRHNREQRDYYRIQKQQKQYEKQQRKYEKQQRKYEKQQQATEEIIDVPSTEEIIDEPLAEEGEQES